MKQQKHDKKERKEQGITLVALVVTIVVLLILAGITITYVMGDNGIIKKAQEAKNKMEQAIQNEQQEIEDLENWLSSQHNVENTPTVDDKPEEKVKKFRLFSEDYKCDEQFIFDTGMSWKDFCDSEFNVPDNPFHLVGNDSERSLCKMVWH